LITTAVKTSNSATDIQSKDRRPHYVQFDMPFNVFRVVTIWNEQLGVDLTISTYIREVLSSNLWHNIFYPDIFRVFPQYLQANIGIK
jgi:hypothetical protein